MSVCRSRRASPLTTKLEGFGTTIFGEMTSLAIATGSINLGQGFPDTDGPVEVLDAAVEAIRDGVNQYPPPLGEPVLRQAIARHQSRFYGLEPRSRHRDPGHGRRHRGPRRRPARHARHR